MQRVWAMNLGHLIWWVVSSIEASGLGWVEGKLYHARALIKYECVLQERGHLGCSVLSPARGGQDVRAPREAPRILRRITKSGRSKLRPKAPLLAGEFDEPIQDSSVNRADGVSRSLFCCYY